MPAQGMAWLIGLREGINMRARSQHYATETYKLVSEVPKTLASEVPKEKLKTAQNRYGALCYSFPLIVRENGLAAALGFLAAKSEAGNPEGLLLKHYAQILGFNDPQAMQDFVVQEAELPEYRRLTLQVLKLAEWFKRYAEGVLKVNATGDSMEGGEKAI